MSHAQKARCNGLGPDNSQPSSHAKEKNAEFYRAIAGDFKVAGPSGWRRIGPMQDVLLKLPGESLIGARIPPFEIETELRRRLAAALFSDGIISGAAACRMAGMDKAEFQFMLGERGHRQPLTQTDYEQDLTNLTAWKKPLIISNTTPIINFSEIDCLDVLSSLFKARSR